VDFEALRGLLRRVAEEVEAEIKQVGRELAEARRGGAKRRVEKLSAVKDTLCEDKWFRIATAVFTQLKKEFAEDGKAAEVIEAAERRQFGLRLVVVVGAPLLKIEAAVNRDGRVAAVRCRAALVLGVGGLYGRGAGLQAGKDGSGKQDSRRWRGRGRQTQRRRRTLSVGELRDAASVAGWSACWRRWEGSSPACWYTWALRRATRRGPRLWTRGTGGT
jgi:hypothetical protein